MTYGMSRSTIAVGPFHPPSRISGEAVALGLAPPYGAAGGNHESPFQSLGSPFHHHQRPHQWILGLLSYVDPFTATAVGRIYLGTRWEGLIIRTLNGGANWASQPSNTSDLLSGVSFVDADNGIAVGEAGTILRTSDGGATWTSPSIGTKAGLYAVSFVSSPCASN